MENYAEIAGLLFRHLQGRLTPEESAQVEAWVAASEQNRQFFDDINNPQALMEEVRALEEVPEIDLEAAWNRIKEQAWEKPAMVPLKPVTKIKRWTAIAAVMIALLIIIIPFYFLWFVHPNTTANLRGDAMPGTNKAYLTLNDGQQIMLDSISNGALAQQGSMQIDKNGRQVSYTADEHGSKEEDLYNKVTVPNGGDVVALELADGTKVWLNAGSTIAYPVSFDKGERKVAITGEAYFEVAGSAGDKEMPFIISKGEMLLTVWGTPQLNVNTYNNEADMKVTLLQGGAKLQFKQSERIIQPGSQVICSHAGIHATSNVDQEQVVAWKKGVFQFSNTNIQPIMRQLERWYDLAPTRYEDEADKKWNFNGQISRYNKASDVLKLLEKTGIVKFVVKDRQITVKKK